MSQEEQQKRNDDAWKLIQLLGKHGSVGGW